MTITINELKDPALRALALAWNKNGDGTLERSELPNEQPDTLALFDRMTANTSVVQLGVSTPAPPTAGVNGLEAPMVAARALAAGVSTYQRAAVVNAPVGDPSLVGGVQVVRQFATADGVYNCTNAAALIGAGASYALAYGVPVGAMAGAAVGSILDSTEYCPTEQINRIAGDVRYLATYVPVDQAALYASVAWHGALSYLGY